MAGIFFQYAEIYDTVDVGSIRGVFCTLVATFRLCSQETVVMRGIVERCSIFVAGEMSVI